MKNVRNRVFSVTSNSDYEILAALRTVETIVRTQRHRRLRPVISFRCSRMVGPGKDLVADWIPVGLSSVLSPW